MENTLKLSIEGMHCGACVNRVTSALKSIEAVEVGAVEVGAVEVGSASVKFDSAKVSVKAITTAVDRIGFPAHIAD
ncbi:MAG TPA: heavy-metal-associated domain-containing protein [Edaphobacter sp.]|nr:heavy-metal-associated domain-containing protein [Edaphobacter sp.]